MENTIVVKLTSDDVRSAGEQIKETLLNAQRHGGKTLFTSGHLVDLKKWKDYLEYFIATSKDGKIALIAKVVDFNCYDKNPDKQPDIDSFPQVPPYAHDDKRTWFALADVQELTIRRGEFLDSDDVDLLDLIATRSSRAYVNYSENQ